MPTGMTLEGTEPKSKLLPCLVEGCPAQVPVTASHFDKAMRFGLPWAVCGTCEAKTDDELAIAAVVQKLLPLDDALLVASTC